ncbi:MAG: Asp-tRNA(Asn)/Glu-tRNA(Gln) amidotransferase subunit GatB [Firmicutes bacterium]|nr:Asp-tRNA(Asn)/Glu-tRNA(Gln) amidotransferase subunit GatB [Bacillota bacterium]
MVYEAVIGLEIHVELLTRSKMFCGCSTAFGDKPNTNTCPVCLGFPGTLPVLNRQAVALAVKAALALQGKVQEKSIFARKNYFYPDLPKAYQISQHDRPLSRGGFLEINFPEGRRRVHLERIHLEEEAGKLIHAGDSILEADYSFVDYNRAGIPLMEIVTLPDLHSGEEARLFLEELRLLLLYVGVSDCKMEEGSLRCDANISLRPAGSSELGVKTEVKNMNSFRAVEQALESEARRQEEILSAGGRVIPATCHWEGEERRTVPVREKGASADYRYFTEPDLPPLMLEASLVEQLRATLPELPAQRRERLQEEYGLEASEALMISSTPPLANFFEEAAKHYRDYRHLFHWIQGDLVYQLRETGTSLETVSPELLIELLELLDKGEINRPVAKELLTAVLKKGASPKKLVASKNLGRISGRETLEPLVAQVLDENPEAIESFLQGRKKALAFLVGKVMALTRGRADPQEVSQLLRDKIK